jgi:hypothetical protein
MVSGNSSAAVRPRVPPLRRALLEAAAVALFGAVFAIIFNAVSPDGLPLFAPAPYETLVPCPEPGGPVQALDPGSPEITSTRSFLVDARARTEFDEDHIRGALHVPYDWLDPVPEETLAGLARAIAASGATRVVVYGDGGRPDSGEHLGKEISGRGIKNVFFIRGGAPAALGEVKQ